MNKMEFADKLEAYNKKQNQNKVFFLLLGLFFVLVTFVPQLAVFLNLEDLGFTSSAFSVFGGLCLGKAWHLRSGTEEHELLINAMDLLSSNKNT